MTLAAIFCHHVRSITKVTLQKCSLCRKNVANNKPLNIFTNLVYSGKYFVLTFPTNFTLQEQFAQNINYLLNKCEVCMGKLFHVLFCTDRAAQQRGWCKGKCNNFPVQTDEVSLVRSLLCGWICVFVSFKKILTDLSEHIN